MQKTFKGLTFFRRGEICFTAEVPQTENVQRYGVGRQIFERRRKLGLTKKALAGKFKVNREVIGLWERGVTRPRVSQMRAILQFIGTADWLPRKSLAERLLRARYVMGWSRDAMASHLGTSARTIARLEKGQKSSLRLVRLVSDELENLQKRESGFGH